MWRLRPVSGPQPALFGLHPAPNGPQPTLKRPMNDQIEPASVEIKLRVTQRFHDEIFEQQPHYLDRANYLRSLLASAIDGVATIPTCRAGGGRKGGSKEAVKGPIQEPEKVQPDNVVQLLNSLLKVLTHVPPNDGVVEGKGVQGENYKEGFFSGSYPPKEPVKKPRGLPANLVQHEEALEKFWAVKQGSRSNQAWELLTTELTKIQQSYGDEVVAKQLQLAVIGNGDGKPWISVTLNNYERYGKETGASNNSMSRDEQEKEKFLALFSSNEPGAGQ